MILTTFRRAKHFYLYILVRLGVYYSGQTRQNYLK